MDNSVVIFLSFFFIFITVLFVGLMFMLPEWFGISKNHSSPKNIKKEDQ